MLGIVKSIEEITGLKLGNTGSHTGTNGSRLGMAQMINVLFGGGGNYDGYKIETTEHVYHVLIENGQSCCENWGYLISEDDTAEYIGKCLVELKLTDTGLNQKMLENDDLKYIDDGGVQFVDFSFSDGSVLQLAVYNAHNGYYGHSILIAKDNEILLSDTL